MRSQCVVGGLRRGDADHLIAVAAEILGHALGDLVVVLDNKNLHASVHSQRGFAKQTGMEKPEERVAVSTRGYATKTPATCFPASVDFCVTRPGLSLSFQWAGVGSGAKLAQLATRGGAVNMRVAARISFCRQRFFQILYLRIIAAARQFEGTHENWLLGHDAPPSRPQ